MAEKIATGAISVGDLTHHLDDLPSADDELSRVLVPEVWDEFPKEFESQRRGEQRLRFLRMQVMREIGTALTQRVGLEPWGRLKIEYVPRRRLPVGQRLHATGRDRTTPPRLSVSPLRAGGSAQLRDGSKAAPRFRSCDNLRPFKQARRTMSRTCAVVFVLLSSVGAHAATNIGVILDTQRAATALIGRDGGTLTATAADGTIFTLTIPAKALLSGEQITMTPLMAATGLPFTGGLVAAVQLEPNGLRLLELATLAIATPQPIPLAAQTPIAWRGQGNDLHLHALTRDPRTIQFKLTHFSGAGMSNGTAAERSAYVARIPCDSEAALQQRLMPILEAERKRVLDACPPPNVCPDLPPNPAFTASIQVAISDYYNFSIRPMMVTALQSGDDDILYSAVLKAFSAVRVISFWLDEDDPLLAQSVRELNDFVAEALKKISDKAFQRCIENHRPEEIVKLMAVDRAAQILGIPIDLQTQSKVDRCGSFELVFDSTMTESGGPYWNLEMHASSTIPIQASIVVQSTGEPVTVSAPLDYSVKVMVNIPNCTASATATGDTFKITEFELKLNPKELEDVCRSRRRAVRHASIQATKTEEPTFEVASMTIDPGHPKEGGDISCGGVVLGTLEPGRYRDAFNLFHSVYTFEMAGQSGPFKIINWSPGDGGSLLAQKHYDLTHNDAQGFYMLHEVTSLKLYHRPGP